MLTGIGAPGFAAGAASWHPCARMKSQAAERRVVRSLASLVVAFVVLAATEGTPAGAQAPQPRRAPRQVVGPLPAEPHLADVRRLTEGGENAEAYWSPDGKRLIFQRTSADGGCDQIYRLDVDDSARIPAAPRLSSGRGRTTCGYFLPDGERFLYSTTELFAPECPPPPDRSRGYVWAVYDSYEIVLQNGAGTPRRLTDNRAYDAEATVCPRDGSIVFTSDRDGDLELYRMDADGANVARLTNAPGYDGGAFFSPDCSRIVWRAARPQGAALAEARELLAQHLVKPSQLELWTARADGSEAQQVTYLGVASFAPSFFPSGDRIVFASNLGDANGREFDLWAIDVAGTRLERITASPGFDGFPMFSPDGTRLAFGTNRFVPGGRETDVAVARWVEAAPRFEEGPADRFLADVRWLADDAREGRGVATGGLAAAAEWLAGRFRDIGLAPGVAGGFHQPVQVPTAVRVEPGTALRVDGRELAHGTDFEVAGFSATGSVAGDVEPVGYGIVASEQGRDDYAGVDVKGKVALARRFVPPGDAFADPELARRHGDLRAKGLRGARARRRGAARRRPAGGEGRQGRAGSGGGAAAKPARRAARRCRHPGAGVASRGGPRPLRRRPPRRGPSCGGGRAARPRDRRHRQRRRRAARDRRERAPRAGHPRRALRSPRPRQPGLARARVARRPQRRRRQRVGCGRPARDRATAGSGAVAPHATSGSWRSPARRKGSSARPSSCATRRTTWRSGARSPCSTSTWWGGCATTA